MGGIILNKSPFDYIKDFCKTRNLSKLHERILYHKFQEDFTQFIEDYCKKEGMKPNQDTIKGFESILLSENTLSTNIKLAEDELNEYLNKEISTIKKGQSFKEFGFSVLASVVASFVFTILLIMIFSMGQSQIKSWVNDMYKSDKQIQQTVISDEKNK